MATSGYNLKPVWSDLDRFLYLSLIVASALQSGCSYLYSDDLQSGQKIRQLTIINPFI